MILPTTSVGWAIFSLSLVLEGKELIDAYGRLANGITARAQSEGRPVTDQEKEVINGALAEAERLRKGQ